MTKFAVNAVQHTALKIQGAETIRGPAEKSPGHVDSPQASWHHVPSISIVAWSRKSRLSWDGSDAAPLALHGECIVLMNGLSGH